jgi:hypothetical protein
MQSEPHRPSRLAIAFVVVGLALSAIGIGYIVYAGRERQLPPISAPHADPQIEQLHALVAMLTLSFFLFLAFLFGSYLMVRLGRRVADRRPPRQPSEYVDVWGNYRLTQEQIEAATRQLRDDVPPAPPPDDAEPEPPDEKP